MQFLGLLSNQFLREETWFFLSWDWYKLPTEIRGQARLSYDQRNWPRISMREKGIDGNLDSFVVQSKNDGIFCSSPLSYIRCSFWTIVELLLLGNKMDYFYMYRVVTEKIFSKILQEDHLLLKLWRIIFFAETSRKTGWIHSARAWLDRFNVDNLSK